MADSHDLHRIDSSLHPDWTGFCIPEVLKPGCASKSAGGLVKPYISRLTLKVSVSEGLGRGLRICISSRFPGDADAAGRDLTLRTWLSTK